VINNRDDTLKQRREARKIDIVYVRADDVFRENVFAILDVGIEILARIELLSFKFAREQSSVKETRSWLESDARSTAPSLRESYLRD
jgi:hypothetical protein